MIHIFERQTTKKNKQAIKQTHNICGHASTSPTCANTPAHVRRASGKPHVFDADACRDWFLMGGTARLLFLNPDQICLRCHFYSPQPPADTAGTSPACSCVCVCVCVSRCKRSKCSRLITDGDNLRCIGGEQSTNHDGDGTAETKWKEGQWRDKSHQEGERERERRKRRERWKQGLPAAECVCVGACVYDRWWTDCDVSCER